jgi:hypothetical protein
VGDTNNMMSFNTVIQAHDLEEIPLKDRSFTWSNMQDAPLLEKYTRFLLHQNGQPNFPILFLFLSQDWALITILFMFRLVMIFPNQMFLDLRIFGWILKASWML